MTGVRVDGATELRLVAQRLRWAASKGLRVELTASIRGVVKPLMADARSNARAILPRAGGLNEVIAASRMNVRVLTGIATSGVRVEVLQHSASIDRGIVRHPVFGHRDRPWESQSVAPGWFTDAMEAGAPLAEAAVIGAIESTARRIDEGVR